MGENPIGGGGEIDAGVIRAQAGIEWIGGLDGRGGVPTGLDQHGATTGGGASGDVGDAVADHEAARGVDVKLGGGLQEHAGTRFAALAIDAVFGKGCFGMVRAKIKGIERRAPLPLQEAVDFGVDFADLIFGCQATGDDGLIADDDEEKSGVLQAAKRGGGAGRESNLRRVREEIDVVDEDAVAIEKNRFS